MKPILTLLFFLLFTVQINAQKELGITYSGGTNKGFLLNFESYTEKKQSVLIGLGYNYSVKAEGNNPIQFSTEPIKTYELRFEMRKHFDTQIYFTKFFLHGSLFADYVNTNQESLGGYDLKGLGGGIGAGGGIKFILSKKLVISPSITFRKAFASYYSSIPEIDVARRGIDRLLSINLSYRFGGSTGSVLTPKMEETKK
ncbi:MAG: hypothetical protein MUF45_16155 [Spirosomaceae bacterium]|jgi:hypothetical protein|nr:hypothetical protein [Spirosomataceae bacterium]